jgi:hypothetical protein
MRMRNRVVALSGRSLAPSAQALCRTNTGSQRSIRAIRMAEGLAQPST